MLEELGRLELVDPRTVWEHEAHDFTPWLLANADRLSESLGIDIDLEAAEHAVGGYSLDLVGRDITNDTVLIIENQLLRHRPYAPWSGADIRRRDGASTIVWIATAFREEHRQALDWLNESTDEKTHFFGIELQVVKIDDSRKAPLLNLVVQPNDWQKQVRTRTRTRVVSEREELYTDFWRRFLEQVHAEHPDWTRSRATNTTNWFEMKSPIKGTYLSSSFASNDRLRFELYIDAGDAVRNMEIFEHFRNRHEQIEAAYGGALSWEDLPGRRACRIAAYNDDGCNILQADRHDEFIAWLLDAGTRLRNALSVVPPPPSPSIMSQAV